MEHVLERIAATETWRSAGGLTVFGTYEDYPAGARVYELCRSLSAFLGPKCAVRRTAWPFSEFRGPALRAAAARETLLADLVVISTRRGEGLPVELQEWLDLWLTAKPRRPSVMGAIFERGFRQTNNPVRAYLQERIVATDLEFFVLPEAEPAWIP